MASTMNGRRRHKRPYKDRYVNVPFQVDEDGSAGGFDADDIGAVDERINSGAREMRAVNSMPIATILTSPGGAPIASRTSELTISFEGEVYVFPAVPPEKVQAVLLLLGGRDVPRSIRSSEFLLQQNCKMMVPVNQMCLDELRHWLDFVRRGKRDALRRRFGTLAEKKLHRGCIGKMDNLPL